MCRSEFADLKVWQGESPNNRMEGDGLAIGFPKAGALGARLLTSSAFSRSVVYAKSI